MQQKPQTQRSGKIVILVIIGIVILLLTGRFFLLKNDPSIRIQAPSHFGAPLDTGKITVHGASLGRILFNDPILSRHQKTSCASCHQQGAAYADLQKSNSVGDLGHKTSRNSPVLTNLIWKSYFFQDGRATTLKETILNAIRDTNELNSDIDLILDRLNNQHLYQEKFQRITKREKIEASDLLSVLSQYLRTLNSWNTRYDEMMLGKAFFSGEERKGWTIFQEHCQSCHSAPFFTTQTGHVVAGSGADLGMYIHSHKEEDRYRFMSPTLRNIQYSAPYMHDGRFDDLRGLLRFHGDPINTPGMGKKLTDSEVSSVISFLKTLSDKAFISTSSY
ncbi:cytochrome-c peroxidase [Sphingobacterium psychroaquaticum]|uniref:Cytochrome c peroxidase n=1 Tax=Sphingobacterium psychroaquaticum TaxID=561061 RepID=A0A1X7IIJ1_9SPHI|nr:cytochrome c peroxidase [Sphingobacterium psychroaquaticum]QBQ41485.1 c-type cytochrome [Sphingobacterium psychroaquaticum]SMG14631.1 cytochrome c peroxidase [Sphingobacterium psychroaquaticum]